MKSIVCAAALCVGVVFSGVAAEQTFVVDTVHSSVGFRIRHFYADFARGMNAFSGTIICDTNDLTTMKVSGVVEMASVDTGNEDRDKHIRSGDFFDVTNFALATFQSTQVTPGPDGALKIKGPMTIRGKSADVEFDGRILGAGPDHKGVLRVGYHGEATIDRTAFGIVYNMTLSNGVTALGTEVKIILDIEAIEKTPEDAEAKQDSTLAGKLSAEKTAERKSLSPEDQAALDAALASIAGQKVSGLAVGAKAPDFTLPDSHGKKQSLSSMLKKGPVVLVFYYGQWCPFCNLQLRALEDAYPQIRESGASLVAVSPQTVNSALVQEGEANLTFPLLTDTEGDVARSYKLTYRVPEDMKRVYKAKYGIDLSTYNASGKDELPVTATFVIGKNRKIAAAVVDVDYTKRMEPADILAALKNMGK